MKKLLAILGLGFILRTVWLGSVPIGLYSDEAAFGYNAYLLLNTGRDEYGRFWPVSLESFGDWKPPMSAWLAIPTIAIFGLNEFAVRLPSAILGTATVAVVYFLAKEILMTSKMASSDQLTPLLSALLLAISPWHIFMSRIAMLASIEVFFISLGILGLIKGPYDTVIPAKAGIYRNILYRFRVKYGMTNLWWMVVAASFAGAIYSYYGSRVTVPLILSIFCLVYFNEVKKRLREIIFPVIFGVALLSPLVIQSIGDPLILTGRARTTSVFFNDNVRLQLWDAHTKAGLKNIPPLTSRFFDNKLYYYARDIAGRYASHFSPLFLFFKGDSHPPFKIPGLGYLHLIDLPFFVIGLIFLRMNRNEIATSRRGGTRNDGQLFLILYLLAAPAVAALTFLTPAANRSFNLVIPWTLITAYGLAKFLSVIPAKAASDAAKAGIYSDRFRVPPSLTVRLNELFVHGSRSAFRRAGKHGMTIVIIFLYLISLLLFLYSYVWIIPQELPHYWHYGRRELVNKLRPYIDEKRQIYLTNKGGPPYIFLSFYLPIPADDFYLTVKRNPVINDLGWGHVDGILGITIPREFQWNEIPKERDALYVGFEDEIPESEVDILDRVYYPNGRPVYTLAKLKQ